VQAETKWKKFCPPTIGEEAEVADVHKATRQHVEQEATQELTVNENAPNESEF
jgi:hypothetical protein